MAGSSDSRRSTPAEGAARERRATQSVRAALDAGDAGLRVPHLLGGDGATLALEPLPGRRLDVLPAAHGSTRSSASAPHWPRCTACARRTARASPASLPTGSHARSARSPRRNPPPGAPQPSSSRRCSAGIADATAPAVCVHGDANLRNALLDGDRVSLIDLEDVAAGPAAADVGHVLAATAAARA